LKKQSIWKIFFLAIIVAVTSAIITINLQPDLIQIENLSFDGIPKAAIIDQLHNEKPNKNYQQNVTKYLETAGYEVDLYTTDDITVDFYKKLPSLNYEFIVIRTHSLGIGDVEESSSLFTGEIYNHYDHIPEQYSRIVGHGVPYLPREVEELGGLNALKDETYFVVGSKFIDEVMLGTFPKSKIILAGCETSKTSQLAKSFLKRGALEVVGWSGLVDSGKNDMVLLELFDIALGNDVEMKDAVDLVMNSNLGTFYKPTNLVYFSNEPNV